MQQIVSDSHLAAYPFTSDATERVRELRGAILEPHLCMIVSQSHRTPQLYMEGLKINADLDD